jgi:hypothetical protein
MDDKKISEIAIKFQEWLIELCEQRDAVKEAQNIIDDKGQD